MAIITWCNSRSTHVLSSRQEESDLIYWRSVTSRLLISCLKIPCGCCARRLRREEQMPNQNNVNSDICRRTERIWNSSLTSDIYIICENIYFCYSFRKAKCAASIKSATSNTNWLHPSDLSFYLRKAVISNPQVRVTCATLASPDVITRRLRVPSVWVFSEMCHICGHIKPGLLVLMLLVHTIFQPEPVMCM